MEFPTKGNNDEGQFMKQQQASFSLLSVLNRANGDFKPVVLVLVFDEIGRVISRNASVVCKHDKRVRGDTSVHEVFKRLEVDIQGPGVSKRQILDAPVLVTEQILIATRGYTEYVTFVIAGLYCENLEALEARSSHRSLKVWNIEDLRSEITKQKTMPEYVWQLYTQAVKALEALLRERK